MKLFVVSSFFLAMALAGVSAGAQESACPAGYKYVTTCTTSKPVMAGGPTSMVFCLSTTDQKYSSETFGYENGKRLTGQMLHADDDGGYPIDLFNPVDRSFPYYFSLEHHYGTATARVFTQDQRQDLVTLLSCPK